MDNRSGLDVMTFDSYFSNSASTKNESPDLKKLNPDFTIG